MKFHGLFLGINKYADPRIQWLAGAVQDAEALHGLFADTFGADQSTLVTDEAASAGGIRDALAGLQMAAGEDDIVVITFAGHGSEDHFLIPFDTNAGDLAGSAISLEEFAELISAVPGRTLLCALDCCFSGGLGARVFTPEVRLRQMVRASVADTLDRFVGEGRLALTASAQDQAALESARHGHGLLTFRLLEALQGVPEVSEGDQVNLYKVIEYVTRHVEADARQMGHDQTPALRGKIDGAPLWPQLVAGSIYSARFPERVRRPAAPNPTSLAAFGIGSQITDRWGGLIEELNELQLRAINEFGLLDGESLVVTAPTSSGKTMIGEVAALRAAAAGERAIFLLPMKALVNDKFDYFQRLYDPLGIRTIRATGDHRDDVPAFLRGQFGIALLTYEKYRMLALGNPHVLDLAATVVVDEAQTLTDASRGSNLEFVLTLLNNRRGQTGAPQIITLSAVVGDLGGLDRWLGGRHLRSDHRPVPLVEGVLDRSGGLTFLDGSGEHRTERFIEPLYDPGSRAVLIPLLRRLLDEGKKVIVFRQSKNESVACAVYLSRSLGLPAAEAVLAELTGEPSASTVTLRQTLGQGVAFHNADLDRDERRVIEDGFRAVDSDLRVVVATPTLAMGVNTPAGAVAIVGLTHPGAQPTPYTVAEYKNMVGRAGRLGITDHGESYLIPEGQLDTNRAWHGYVKGQLEDLRSKLVPDGDPRTLVLAVLAAFPADVLGRVPQADVLDFLESSFAAFQAREGGSAQWTEESLRRSLQQLVGAELIDKSAEGYRLTDLGRFTGEAGVHVDSILRLVYALRGVTDLTSVDLIAAAQITNELDNVYLGVNAKATRTEVPRWPGLLRHQGVPESIVQGLGATSIDRRQAIQRPKRASAAILWVNGLALNEIEAILNQHMYNRNGLAGTIRGIAERTRDLLPAVDAVFRQLHPDNPQRSDLVDRTMLRLELGLPSEMVDLAECVSFAVDRQVWLQLKAEGLTTIDSLLKVDPDRLASVVGSPAVATQMRADVEDAKAHAALTSVDLPPPTE
jgi:helicase